MTLMRPAVRATLLSIGFAAVLLAGDAMACPSCAGSASPKDPAIWPLIGLFMLVPWALAAGAVLVIRRESRSA